ncbi:MAG: alpha-glucosidase C-terminal domain-containing protein, partial [Actinomycetota bacterium]|nr:alpha-glucosidase C-terminal domain-containing protein [Actinomycetota bacterium]
ETAVGDAADAQGMARSTGTVLCVCNLSRFAQPAELPLQRWEGLVPVELLGRVTFPRVGELPYFVTLSPYGFYWFELTDRGES